MAEAIIPQGFRIKSQIPQGFRIKQPTRLEQAKAPGSQKLVEEQRRTIGAKVLNSLEKTGTGVIQLSNELGSRAFTDTIRNVARFVAPEFAEEIKKFTPDEITDIVTKASKEKIAEREARVSERTKGLGAVTEFATDVAQFAGAGPLTGAAAFGLTRPVEVGEGLPERAKETAISTAVGVGTLGAIKGTVGAGKLISKAYSRSIKGRPAEQMLLSRIPREDIPGVKQALESGEGFILPDVGGDSVRGLTRAVARYPETRKLVTEVFEKRSKQATQRVNNILRRDVSNVDSYFGNIDDTIQTRADLSAPLYEEAFTKTPIIKSPKITKLLGDDRIQDAIKVGKRDFGVPLDAADNSLQALDGAKKSMDDIIQSAQREGRSQKARAFVQLKKELVDEIDIINPEYGKARQVFSDYSSLKNAQEKGLQFNKFGSAEEIKRFTKNLNAGEKEAFKIGVRENQQRIVEKTPLGSDPAKRLFGKTLDRQKLRAVFDSPQDFKNFSTKIRSEITRADTKAKILGGSRTDFNVTDDGQFIKEAGATARRIGYLGIAKGFLFQTIDVITGSIHSRYVGITPQNAKKLAKILTDRKQGINALNKILQEAPVEQQSAISEFIQDVTPIMAATQTQGE